MKKLSARERTELVDAAMGKRKFDCVITNIQLVNVFSGEIYPAEIGMCNSYIAHVAEKDGESSLEPDALSVYDGQGAYAVPGFLDSHMHIESSMLTPYNFAKIVIPKGTTTIVTDPHEIGNVMGIDGVAYMIEAGKDLPMYQYALAPSCVPAVPGLEEAGAVFGRDEIAAILDMDHVFGIAEVMDFYGVIDNSPRMREILDLALERDCFIQGHFFSEKERELSAYLCAGPNTNHEIMTGDDTIKAIRSGMIVDSRESSFAKHTTPIIEAIKDFRSPPNLTFCTDDRSPKHIKTKGHINDCIRVAVKAGLNPIDAIRAATIQSANAFGFKRIGAIAPGYVANINLVDNLENVNVESVFFEGNLVAEKDRLLVEIGKRSFPLEQVNSVHLDNFSEDRLRIKAPIEEGKAKVRVIKYQDLHSLLTELAIEEVTVKDGFVSIEDKEDLNYIAIFNRHPGKDNFAVGVVANFHLTDGALAGTVSHDCHNLCVVYRNIDDAVRAVKEIQQVGGGVVYSKGSVLEKVELPIGGLLSSLDAEAFIPQVENINEALRGAGVVADNPVMRLATAALPVMPSIKITDLGIVDVINKEFLDVFV